MTGPASMARRCSLVKRDSANKKKGPMVVFVDYKSDSPAATNSLSTKTGAKARAAGGYKKGTSSKAEAHVDMPSHQEDGVCLGVEDFHRFAETLTQALESNKFTFLNAYALRSW